jgi:membrane associated rhomboid family serine protease
MHKNMTARRWPVVTISLVLINVAAYLYTYPQIISQESTLSFARQDVLSLAARHPELKLPPAAAEFVDDVQASDPAAWAALQTPSLWAVDQFDLSVRTMTDPRELQQAMDTAVARYSDLAANSTAEHYAFFSVRPSPLSYITSMFLHAGALHLIANMWFLWLAGIVLEDAWGRPLYLGFYFLAGLAGTQVHALLNPGSFTPLVGASGAVAGLMGAFLVCYPKLKIQLVVYQIFSISRPWVSAYWLLPLWFVMQVFGAKGLGPKDGVPYWQLAGGFTFGVLAALAIHNSRLEKRASQAIEDKVSFVPDAEVKQASELIEQGKLDEAASVLKMLLETNSDSVGAWNLLRSVHWKRQEIPACCEIAGKLCAVNIRTGMPDAAWLDYQEYDNLGGDKLPPAVWLEVCRVPEANHDYKSALKTYEKLAATHPARRQGLIAQIAAARILLINLDRPDEALQRYQSAWDSNVPHADLNREIDAGIKAATLAVRKKLSPTL